MILIRILSLILCLSLASETLIVENAGEAILLESAIYDNSLQITDSAGKILEEGEDYAFEKGIISIKGDALFPLTVFFEKTRSPLLYSYKKFFVSEDTAAAVEENAEKEDSSSLDVNGLKSFLITSSGSGVSLDQSLDITVAGELSEGWLLNGKIYDNTSDLNAVTLNTPLRQLENINITLTGPKSKFSLGSSSFGGFSNEFSSLYREIFGLNAEIEILGAPLYAAVAGQKGRFSTLSFYCTDGIQGPYRLTDNAQLSMYVIAPGSEKIYLDGALLSGGEGKDYTIDYFSGEITFSPTVMVTSESFVFAEFQLYEELAPVAGYFFKAGKDSSGISVLYTHEEESVSDEATRLLLENAPSDSSEFSLSGVSYVGAGNGDYLMRDSVYIYEGAGGGDYRIVFYYSGYGKGDYVYSPSMSCYVYAGGGLGNYSTFKTMKMPFSSDYLSVSFKKKTKIGTLFVQGSNGLFKENRYSLEEGRKSGLSVGGEYSTPAVSLGKLSALLSLSAFSRSDIYVRKWSVPQAKDEFLNAVLPDNSASGESRIRSDVSYDTLLSFGGYWAFLDSSGDGRVYAQTDTLYGFFISASRRVSFMKDSPAYSSSEARLGKKLSPFVAYAFTKQRGGLATSYEENGGGALFIPMNMRAEYSIEKSCSASRYTGRTRISRLEFYDTWSRISASLSSELRMSENLLTKSLSDRFGLSSSVSAPLGPAFDGRASLTVTSLSAYRNIDHYVYAGEGRGDYVYDPETETYIYDETYGSYVKITEREQGNEPAAGRTLNFSVRSELKSFLLTADVSYSDLSASLLKIDSAFLETRNYYVSLKSQYGKYSSAIPFAEISSSADYRRDISSFSSNSLFAGIKGDLDIPYSAGGVYSSESQRYQNGDYFITARKLRLSLLPSQENASYSFSFSYGLFRGSYAFVNFPFTAIEGRTLFADILSSFAFKRGFSLSIAPSAAYNEYLKGSSEPMAIHYKYPEGVSFSGKISLTYSNSFINGTLSYIGEFDERYSFRQRTEASLFTYF